MNIKVNDFCYIRRKKVQRILNPDELHLLKSYEKKGKNKAIILVHGFASTPESFRNMLPELNKIYDGIYCPVLPGHGESIKAFSKTTFDSWLQALINLCQKMNYQTIDILGFSAGGLLALSLAKLFDFNHIYLLAPALALNSPFSLATTIKISKILQKIGVSSVRNLAGNMLNNNEYELTYRQLPLGIVSDLLINMQNFEYTPPSSKMDVFLGKHDTVICSNSVNKIFTESKNCRIHWLHNSAHLIPLEKEVKIIIDCIITNNEASEELNHAT